MESDAGCVVIEMSDGHASEISANTATATPRWFLRDMIDEHESGSKSF